jgi:hypothetical protein
LRELERGCSDLRIIDLSGFFIFFGIKQVWEIQQERGERQKFCKFGKYFPIFGLSGLPIGSITRNPTT